MEDTNDHQETQHTLCSFCEVIDRGHGYDIHMGFGVHVSIWRGPRTIFQVKAFCHLSAEGAWPSVQATVLTDFPSFTKNACASLQPGILSTPVGRSASVSSTKQLLFSS